MTENTARPNDDGMSLVEIIAVITVMGILSAVVAHAVGFWNGVGRKTHQLILREQELDSAVSRIIDGTPSVEGLISAVSFCVPHSSEISYTQTTLTPVRYFLQAEGTSCSGTPDTSNKKLCVQVDSSTPTVAVESIDSFSAHKNGNIATISISTTVTGTGGPRTLEFTTSVSPRNIL